MIEEKRLEGIVLWFNERKGFGFLEDEKEKEDYFFHYSDILNLSKRRPYEVYEGDKVTFILYEDRTKGLLAKRVLIKRDK